MRIASVLLLAALVLIGCQVVQNKNNQPELTVKAVKGNELLLVGSGIEMFRDLEIEVMDAGSGESYNLIQMEDDGTVWILGLDLGRIYNFQLWGKDERGARKRLTALEFDLQRGEKSSRLLKPEDFEFASEKKLNIPVLLSIPQEGGGSAQSQDEYEKMRRRLEIVSRRMAEIFIGDTFLIGERDEILVLEDTRRILQMNPDLQNRGMIYGFAAPALLAIDLRLPDGEHDIPCQLSIRLLDISHPSNRDQKLWNRRPLLYEDFVEIAGFRPGDESNYDQLIVALEKGLIGLCEDRVVKAYRDLVTAPEVTEGYYRKLWDCIGIGIDVSQAARISDEDASKQSYDKVLSLMFAPIKPPDIVEEATPADTGEGDEEAQPETPPGETPPGEETDEGIEKDDVPGEPKKDPGSDPQKDPGKDTGQ